MAKLTITAAEFIQHLESLLDEYIYSSRFFLFQRVHGSETKRLLTQLKHLEQQNIPFKLALIFLQMKKFCFYLEGKQSHELMRILHHTAKNLLFMLQVPFEHHANPYENMRNIFQYLADAALCQAVSEELRLISKGKTKYLFMDIQDCQHSMLSHATNAALQSIRHFTQFVSVHDGGKDWPHDFTQRAFSDIFELQRFAESLNAQLEQRVRDYFMRINVETVFTTHYRLPARRILTAKNNNEWLVSHKRLRYGGKQSCLQMLAGVAPEFLRLLIPVMHTDGLLMFRVSRYIESSLEREITLRVSDPTIHCVEKTDDSVLLEESVAIKSIHLGLFGNPVTFKNPILIKDKFLVRYDAERDALAVKYPEQYLSIDQQLPNKKLTSLMRIFF